MKSSVTRAFSPLDIEEWARKIERVWKPTRLCEIRVRTGGGLVFIGELECGLTLQLGVQPEGIDTCALWCGEECVLWDARLGFCWVFGIVPALPEHKAAISEAPLCRLIRRNCFLLGAPVEASDEEKFEWLSAAEMESLCAAD